MRVWIVRKHPPYMYNHKLHLAAFTICGAYATRKDAKTEADRRQPKSRYLFTVGYVELREGRA